MQERGNVYPRGYVDNKESSKEMKLPVFLYLEQCERGLGDTACGTNIMHTRIKKWWEANYPGQVFSGGNNSTGKHLKAVAEVNANTCG